MHTRKKWHSVLRVCMAIAVGGAAVFWGAALYEAANNRDFTGSILYAAYSLVGGVVLLFLEGEIK